MNDVYNRMKDDILVGVLGPGTPLVETTLATRYAVSRTPVREALRRLEHDGLLERGPRSLQVRQSTPQEIYDLNDVRTVLETTTARRAAERHTELDLVLLYDLLDRMEREDLDVPARVRLNRQFHASVWHAGHNATLCQTLERLYLTEVPALHTTLASTPRWRQAVAEHRAVVDAIAAGDAETAARVLEEHLRIGRDLRLAQLARGGHEPTETIREAS